MKSNLEENFLPTQAEAAGRLVIKSATPSAKSPSSHVDLGLPRPIFDGIY